jgi:hypothetical protein
MAASASDDTGDVDRGIAASSTSRSRPARGGPCGASCSAGETWWPRSTQIPLLLP